MNKKNSQIMIRVGLTSMVFVIGLAYIFITQDAPTGPPDGEEMYQTYCGNCHGKEGEGFKSLYPPLAGSDYLKEHATQLPCIIKKGLSDPITVNGKEYTMPMAGIEQLTDWQITQISNYVLETWADMDEPFSKKKVEKELNRCP